MRPILLITALFSLSMSGLAQLPVKDGIVYYKFQENIESDTCASSYVINASEIMLYDKINGEIFIYNNKKSSEKKKTSNKVGRIGIFIPCVESLTKNCSASARVNNDTKLEISLTSELVPIKFVDVLGEPAGLGHLPRRRPRHLQVGEDDHCSGACRHTGGHQAHDHKRQSGGPAWNQQDHGRSPHADTWAVGTIMHDTVP